MIGKSTIVVSILTISVGFGLGVGSAQAQIGFRMSEVTPGFAEIPVCDEIFVLADTPGKSMPDSKFVLEYALMDAFVDGIPRGGHGAGERAAQVRHRVPPFVRASFSTSAFNKVILGDTNPLETAIVSNRRSFQSAHWSQFTYGRRGAWVVFSDGKANRKRILKAAERLAAEHRGKLCIYTVLIGDDPKGRQTLEELRALGDCGKGYSASEISSQSGMDSFIREVFFEPESDGDGVPDHLDEFPGTPSGVQVDERGRWVLRDLRFDTARWSIKPEFEGVLDEVARVLNDSANARVRVRVDGHTDSSGLMEDNQLLSQRRADAVRDALLARGVAAFRMESKGFGESSPMRPDDSRANMSLNRRVELTVMSGMENPIREEYFDTDTDTDTVASARANTNTNPDADGDGIPNSIDECQGTPSGARVDERGCWVLTDLNFDKNTWDVKDEFEGLLGEVAQVLNDSANAGIRVRVDGHTDASGSDAYNQTVSERRANAVRDYLVAHGIAAFRMDARGFGEVSPIRPNDTSANMYLNRRVELTVIK